MTCLGTWDNLRVGLVLPYYLSRPGKPKGEDRHKEYPE